MEQPQLKNVESRLRKGPAPRVAGVDRQLFANPWFTAELKVEKPSSGVGVSWAFLITILDEGNRTIEMDGRSPTRASAMTDGEQAVQRALAIELASRREHNTKLLSDWEADKAYRQRMEVYNKLSLDAGVPLSG